MPRYRYKAVNKEGVIKHGVLIAANENEASTTLGMTGFEIISIKQKKPVLWQFPRTTPLSLKEKEDLCRQLSALLSVGVPAHDAIGNLLEGSNERRTQAILETVKKQIGEGASLSSVFSKAFSLDAPAAAVLIAGEANGKISEAFLKLSERYLFRRHLTAQLRNSLRYPLFLMLVAGFAAVFMLGFVVPGIVDFLSSIDGEIPLATRMLISFSSHALGIFSFVVCLALSLAFCLLLLRRLSSQTRLFADRLLLKVPVLGRYLFQIDIMRFTENMAFLIGGGLDLPQSIALSKGVLKNAACQRQALKLEQDILHGVSFSDAATRLYSPQRATLFRTAEQSGTIAQTLARLHETDRDDLKTSAQNALSFVEPILTLIIGGLLIWVVLAVLGPIYLGLGKLGAIQ